MSFFKSLLLAVIATLFITYVFGHSVHHWTNLDVYMGNQLVEPLHAFGISALAGVILTLVAIAIVVSVFGTLFFVGVLLVGSILLMVLGVFWPIFLIAVIIYWLSQPSNRSSNRTS